MPIAFIPLLAATLSVVLLLLAAIHVAWVVRGSTGGVAVPTRTDGTALFRPGPSATLIVAALLAMAATLVLMRAGCVASPFPTWIVHSGTWAVALAFAARAVGEFRYIGFFRRVRDTAFARWDERLFTPLCCALAVGIAYVAAS